MGEERKVPCEQQRHEQEPQQVTDGDRESPVRAAERTVGAEPEQREVRQEIELPFSGDIARKQESRKFRQPGVEGEVVHWPACCGQYRGRQQDFEREDAGRYGEEQP